MIQYSNSLRSQIIHLKGLSRKLGLYKDGLTIKELDKKKEIEGDSYGKEYDAIIAKDEEWKIKEAARIESNRLNPYVD